MTRQRMYLETMERLLGGTEKFIINSNAANGAGVVPYLSLKKQTNQPNPKRNPLNCRKRRHQAGRELR